MEQAGTTTSSKGYRSPAAFAGATTGPWAWRSGGLHLYLCHILPFSLEAVLPAAALRPAPPAIMPHPPT